ncbi:hypothetical protein ACFL2Q_08105, partial [Thermodesulfobacteriota bacterium]
VIRPNDAVGGGHFFSTAAWVFGGPKVYDWQQGGYIGRPKSAPGPLIDALPHLITSFGLRLPPTAPLGRRALKRLADRFGQKDLGWPASFLIKRAPKPLVSGSAQVEQLLKERKENSDNDQGNKE